MHSDELSSVPKHDNGVVVETRVLHKLHAGMSYSAVVSEVNVNESNTYTHTYVHAYIVFKENHI